MLVNFDCHYQEHSSGWVRVSFSSCVHRSSLYYDLIMSRKSSVSYIRISVFFICCFPYTLAIQGVTDMLHNFEAIDPDVLNIFTFNHKPPPRHRADASEIDISDLDTSDILNCFSTLSYMCFQKKIIFYLDSLNRVDKINLFGGYMSFVKVAPGVTSPITEQLLVSRHITDEMSLGGLLKELFEEFVDNHVLRITVPVINARLDARGARGHCYDFTLGEAKISNDTKGKDIL